MTFDPELHEYRDGDIIIPSVTQILTMAGFIDKRWYSEESAKRGTEVHGLCEDYALGARYTADGDLLSELPYVNSFARFYDSFNVNSVSIEKRIQGEVDGFRYAGTYDLLVETQSQSKVLIDIKTGAKASWHYIQLAAYALQVNPSEVVILYLNPDGTYRQVWITPDELLDGIDKFREAISIIRNKE